jgi:hypothetical protein
MRLPIRDLATASPRGVKTSPYGENARSCLRLPEKSLLHVFLSAIAVVKAVSTSCRVYGFAKIG